MITVQLSAHRGTNIYSRIVEPPFGTKVSKMGVVLNVLNFRGKKNTEVIWCGESNPIIGSESIIQYVCFSAPGDYIGIVVKASTYQLPKESPLLSLLVYTSSVQDVDCNSEQTDSLVFMLQTSDY